MESSNYAIGSLVKKCERVQESWVGCALLRESLRQDPVGLKV